MEVQAEQRVAVWPVMPESFETEAYFDPEYAAYDFSADRHPALAY